MTAPGYTPSQQQNGGKGHDKNTHFRRSPHDRGFTVAYLMTGSVVVGGAIAFVEPAVNTVAYFFHEKMWERVRHARQHPLPA